ncbi:glycosyltransferase [bacterium]|nr:glycosyltransferase [bacterium]
MPSKKTSPQNSHVSLVHDFFIAWGGAEMTFDAITQAFPNNKIYAAFDHPETRHAPLDKVNVTTTFLNKFPFGRTYLLEIYKFLLPLAFSSMRFPKNTHLILSDTASFAKHIIPPPGVKHISYIHTPPRFLWNMPPSKKVRSSNFLRFMWNLLFGSAFRIADFLHAQRIHGLIANSQEVATRIRKYYRREVTAIINPPVYVKKFSETIKNSHIEVKKEFLAFGRIEPYKNFDKLVKAWPKGYKLTIAGIGSQAEEVKKLAKNNPNITFIGRYISDEEKPKLFASYTGFLYPNIEDFGIMMVEAISVGTPVISINAGGAKEIVSHEKTGYLIEQLTTENLTKALEWSLKIKRSVEQREQFYTHMLEYDIENFIVKLQKVAEVFIKR